MTVVEKTPINLHNKIKIGGLVRRICFHVYNDDNNKYISSSLKKVNSKNPWKRIS